MAAKFKNRLFITGALRSGTTLLDKLLNAHPPVTIASQPFFRLFTYVKEKYHRENGINTLPITPLFCEPRYLRNNLDHFLENLNLSESDMSFLRKAIPETNRRWSPAVSCESLSGLRPGYFFNVLDQGMDIVNQVYGRPGAKITGIKEVLCEEFMPFLLGRGFRGIIVLRDPRAAISSATTGGHEEYVGKVRPILLNVRNWRKSVAHALFLRDNPGFCVIKYEDLVCEPEKTLNSIAAFLDIKPFADNFSLDTIKNQDGSAWKGNSSYGDREGIRKNSLSMWKSRLSEDEVSLIEYCCCGEMACLDYEFTTSLKKTRIEDFRDVRAAERAGYAVEHTLNEANVEGEKERFACLTGIMDPTEKKVYDYFYSPDVWRTLRFSLKRGKLEKKKGRR